MKEYFDSHSKLLKGLFYKKKIIFEFYMGNFWVHLLNFDNYVTVFEISVCQCIFILEVWGAIFFSSLVSTI